MNFLQPSLTRRIVISQIIMILIFSILLISNLLWELFRQHDGDFDRGMFLSAKSLAIAVTAESRTRTEMQMMIAAIDRTGREALALYKEDKKLDPNNGLSVVRVTDLRGDEIYTTPGYSTMPFDPRESKVYNLSHHGLGWRAFNYRSSEYPLVVHVAQTNEIQEFELWNLVTTFILWPLLWFLPLAIFTSFLVVVRSLNPLRVLEKVIANRSPSDLKPLNHVAVYAETKPLVNEINLLLHKLDTTLNRERNFLADAAHELRTPLAVIQAQAHVLTHADNDVDTVQASSELNLGIERAASLIQKLLLTAKVSVESFAPRLEAIDLSNFVQDRMAALSVLAAQKNIDIELNSPPLCMVHIDQETFISAIDNVLDNAIRYTPEGGTIQVDITLTSPEKVQLRIADNGTGIAPHLYTRVLERFYRIAGTEQQGSGLGLSIVQRVMKLHDGDVVLAPGLEQRGLSVVLTLPQLKLS
jgi:two-component system, OmpR family, sensor histidine kinase QseC